MCSSDLGFYRERLYLSIRTTNPHAEAGALMHRLVGRRGKGGGHGRTAGGWIDAARLGPEERTRLQDALAEKLALDLRKKPEKITRLALPPTAAAPALQPGSGADGASGGDPAAVAAGTPPAAAR